MPCLAAYQLREQARSVSTLAYEAEVLVFSPQVRYAGGKIFGAAL